jgi:recombination DNA repair RAD52 pathway protein
VGSRSTTMSNLPDSAMPMEPSDTRQFGHGTFTSEESAYLQDTLSKQLGPEWVSNRPGPGGKWAMTLARPSLMTF